ncbi:hypothetical protein KSP39_PZI022104 [Platanthera zijinensis]|uniref:Uncharacterized protein n=1 Tax=Platanthera zijinensis TaxID=2320716 RepID=A0AAP0FVU7_9ASPA
MHSHSSDNIIPTTPTISLQPYVTPTSTSNRERYATQLPTQNVLHRMCAEEHSTSPIQQHDNTEKFIPIEATVEIWKGIEIGMGIKKLEDRRRGGATLELYRICKITGSRKEKKTKAAVEK